MRHAPVLPEEVIRALAIKPDGNYVDCTFGRGGHSRAILQQLGPSGALLAIDRDWDAVHCAEALQLGQDRRFRLVQGRFSDLRRIVADNGWQANVDGILLDVGVSSPQLDDPQRGFSFQKNGPLDMRMDKQAGLSAAQWLAQVDEEELVRVLFEYGEEKFARRIAAAIVRERSAAPLLTTRQLAELIERTVPSREKHKHPATRSFQAVRIAINGELDELRAGLEQATAVLKPGGRLVAISFHSLEDRIVKRFFRDEAGGGYRPGKLPLRQTDRLKARLQKVGKAVQANAAEVGVNPRARSAVLRVAERV
ncbi:MAG: 16S rRNA (cytosine(1402)-N(4))-methyltransferase RsmH [Gammaproteobacteria bacterium]